MESTNGITKQPSLSLWSRLRLALALLCAVLRALPATAKRVWTEVQLLEDVPYDVDIKLRMTLKKSTLDEEKE